VKVTVQDIQKYPVKAIPERGISLETAQALGIRSEFSEVRGTVIAHYFPYTDKAGNVTAYKKRDLTVPKGNEYHITVVGNLTTDSALWNQVNCKASARVWVTEGEYDAACVYQSLMQHQKEPGKYTPNVVSIGLGTANAAKHVGNNTDFLRQYKDVILCFDNDRADEDEKAKGILRGYEATEEVSLLLPGVLNVELPPGIKDPCDLHKVDSKRLYSLLMYEAKPFEPLNVHAGSLGVDELLTPLKTGVYVQCLPETMRKLHGLREREMTVVLAPTNVGKTTICKEITYPLLACGQKVGMIFLEEDLKKTQQSFIAIDQNVWLPTFREDPSILSKEQVQESASRLFSPERALFVHCGHGHIGPDSLMDKVRYLHNKGCRYIVLDHISFVFSGAESSNERKDIDLLLTKLAAFVTATGIHMIVVSHIKRVNNKAPREKDGGVKYPYWEQVDLDMARGSGAFEQLAWNIIALEPERLESGERGRIRTKVLKNREWGWLGVCDYLTMDPHTGRLVVQGHTVEDYDE
jgi:twinkle protein